MKNVFLLLTISIAVLANESVAQTAKLKKVGTRGWYTTVEPFAQFDPDHESVEIWSPEETNNVPLVIYAHGGAGYREDDRARVEMLRRNGYATLSFDAYEMNELDWKFVTRRVSNNGKQNLIWEVFQGAVEYASTMDNWDARNLFYYGASNGGRTVLFAGSEKVTKNLKGIISEAPAATGYALGDCTIPTIVLFGKMDTWAGKSDTDYVWTRTYPNSPISIENWVDAQQEKSNPIKFIFYENAGHLMFEGPLEQVTVKRGDKIAFTAYQGADEKALLQYEKDLLAFIESHSEAKE